MYLKLHIIEKSNLSPSFLCKGNHIFRVHHDFSLRLWLRFTSFAFTFRGLSSKLWCLKSYSWSVQHVVLFSLALHKAFHVLGFFETKILSAFFERYFRYHIWWMKFLIYIIFFRTEADSTLEDQQILISGLQKRKLLITKSRFQEKGASSQLDSFNCKGA